MSQWPILNTLPLQSLNSLEMIASSHYHVQVANLKGNLQHHFAPKCSTPPPGEKNEEELLIANKPTFKIFQKHLLYSLSDAIKSLQPSDLPEHMTKKDEVLVVWARVQFQILALQIPAVGWTKIHVRGRNRTISTQTFKPRKAVSANRSLLCMTRKDFFHKGWRPMCTHTPTVSQDPTIPSGHLSPPSGNQAPWRRTRCRIAVSCSQGINFSRLRFLHIKSLRKTNATCQKWRHQLGTRPEELFHVAYLPKDKSTFHCLHMARREKKWKAMPHKCHPRFPQGAPW